MSEHFIKSDNNFLKLDSHEVLMKPCPFCGGKADYDLEPTSNGYFISCLKCHCSTPLIFSCGEPPGPILLEKWNRRADIKNKFQEHADIVDDLSKLVVRLVRSLRKSAPDNNLSEKALDYLKRNDLLKSPLRGDE